jgi:hypothetical protein
METESEIFVRVYTDDVPGANTLIQERKAEKKTYLHRMGFVRIGAYGVPLADRLCDRLRLEFGLRGRGEVIFADPKLMSVQAIEGAFRGRRTIPMPDGSPTPTRSTPPGVLGSDLRVRHHASCWMSWVSRSILFAKWLAMLISLFTRS